MTDFYRLPDDVQCEKLALLAEKAIEQWPLLIETLTLIKHRENAVYKLITTDGNEYAVRVHRAGYHSNADLRSEIQWMDALRDAGVETPKFIQTHKGESFLVVSHDEVPEPRQIDILEWVEGEAMGSIEEGITNESLSLSDSFVLIGELTAKCHNQSSNWELPEGFERQKWDIEGLVGDEPNWGKFWEYDGLTDEQRATMLAVKDKLRVVLTEFGQSSDRYSMIHCDLLPENLLECDDHYKLIDFDDAGFGWHLFDLATSLFWHLGEDYFDDITNAWIEGYRNQRELPDEHLEMIPVFLMARATAYMGWGVTRSETDVAKELMPLVVQANLELAELFLAD